MNALALQLVMIFVLLSYMLISSKLFSINSGNPLQHKIQERYFYIQAVFVLFGKCHCAPFVTIFIVVMP